MINVVDGGCDKAGSLVEWIEQCFDAIALQEEGGRLEDIGRVSRVVIRVGRMIIGLDDGEPILQCRLVAVERSRHFETGHDRHTEPHQRTKWMNCIKLIIATASQPYVCHLFSYRLLVNFSSRTTSKSHCESFSSISLNWIGIVMLFNVGRRGREYI